MYWRTFHAHIQTDHFRLHHSLHVLPRLKCVSLEFEACRSLILYEFTPAADVCAVRRKGGGETASI